MVQHEPGGVNTPFVNARGHFQVSYSGRRFFPLSPSEEEIDIIDIAHSLAYQNRWGGHSRLPISVGQHSLYVCRLLPQELKLTGLLHDASEAYLVDLPRPIKNYGKIGNEYRKIEEAWMEVLAKKFDTIYPLPREVREADDMVLFAEARDLMADTSWFNVDLAWSGKISPEIAPSKVETRFLNEFRRLGKEKKI